MDGSSMFFRLKKSWDRNKSTRPFTAIVINPPSKVGFESFPLKLRVTGWPMASRLRIKLLKNLIF